MPNITHINEIGQSFALASGDNTVKALLAAAGIVIGDAVKFIEIRCETTGPIGVANRATALTAVADGRSCAQGVSVVRQCNSEVTDLGRWHIWAADANQKAYIEVRTR